MKPKFLYHGSGTAIRGKYLRPFRAGDESRKENALCAVYATERKDIALGMSLVGQPYTHSYGNFDEKPFVAVFLRGKPTRRYAYVYNVSSSSFDERPKGSHQWVSSEPVKIISKERYLVKDLDQCWRPATKKEKKKHGNQ